MDRHICIVSIVQLTFQDLFTGAWKKKLFFVLTYLNCLSFSTWHFCHYICAHLQPMVCTSASRCSTCSYMWQTRRNAQCCGVYQIFLSLEAMHESCNMSVYRNKPVYTSVLIELPKVGFSGVWDSVKEEKFYPFPLCNLQGWLNLFIRYTFWESVLTTLRLEFWALPLELASA